MGEGTSHIEWAQEGPIQPSFNRSIHVEARPTRLSSDTGALMLRELLDHSGVVDWLDEHLQDQRTQDLITHPLPELLRTHLLLLAQGWTHADDADGLRHDPILRLSVSDRRSQSPLRESDDGRPQGLASQPTLSRWIAQAATAPNRAVLEEAVLRSAASRGRLIDRRLRHPTLAVDMDALPMPVHGHQAGVEYNGYFHASGYHPLMLGSAQTGEFFGAVLRPGNVHAHHEAEAAVLQRLDWIQSHLARQVILRFDAASVSDRFLSRLEGRKNTSYVARIKKNARLETLARPLVERYQRQLALDPERLRQEGFRCHELRYQADSWEHPRRMVLVVLERPGELFLDYFWLITNLKRNRYCGARLLGLYRMRGKAEGHMGEFMDVLAPALSSAPRPKSHYRGRRLEAVTEPQEAGVRAQNETLLLLNLLAYEVLHAGRCVMERATGTGWSLRRLRERVLRVASRVVRHGRRLTFVIAQDFAPDWQRLWGKLAALDWAPG
jgi:hypothetical protein